MRSTKKLKFTEHKEPELLRLDLGTGKAAKKPDGFTGVDLVRSPGVDVVTDLRKPWPWKANSVDEVLADYLLQYLTAPDRVHFANELYRVLKPGAHAIIVTPFWCAHKAYQDIRVAWPPVSEGWFAMLNKRVRDEQNFVDTAGYKCDFDYAVVYGVHQLLLPRSDGYKQEAVNFYREAVQDLHATLTKRA